MFHTTEKDYIVNTKLFILKLSDTKQWHAITCSYSVAVPLGVLNYLFTASAGRVVRRLILSRWHARVFWNCVVTIEFICKKLSPANFLQDWGKQSTENSSLTQCQHFWEISKLTFVESKQRDSAAAQLTSHLRCLQKWLFAEQVGS